MADKARGADLGRGRARRLLRGMSAAFGATLVFTVSTPARAEDASEFEFGKNAYDRGDYEGATNRFKGLLDPAAPACGTPSNGSCRLTGTECIERARAHRSASPPAL